MKQGYYQWHLKPFELLVNVVFQTSTNLFPGYVDAFDCQNDKLRFTLNEGVWASRCVSHGDVIAVLEKILASGQSLLMSRVHDCQISWLCLH